MKAILLLRIELKVIFILTLFLTFTFSKIKAQTTVNYSFTGGIQSFVVPPCVYSINVTAAGAKGGGGNGGNGAVITGTIAVNPGDVLQIRVGGMGACPGTGYNGGGNGPGANNAGNAACGGGGATDLRFTPYALGNRVIVAGGGGGMGGGSEDGQGGLAGCPNGTVGAAPFGAGGGGATTLSGGSAGPPWIASGNPGTAGSLGQGGNGGSDPCYNIAPGAGGGGGLYGGGGGGSDCFGSGAVGGGGGGGGSSLIPGGGGCSAGANTNNGYLSITYTAGNGSTVATSTGPYCVGDMIQLNAPNGATSYSWTGPNGFVSNLQNPTIINSTVANAGVYTLTTMTDGCEAIDDVTVSVNPTPVFSVISSSNPTGCGTNDGTITLGTLTANETYTVTHSGGGSVGMNSNPSGNIIISGLGVGTYSNFIVDYNSCNSLDNSTIILTEPNSPTVIAGNNETLCLGEQITLTATNPDGASISWDNSINDGVAFTPPLGTTIYTVSANLIGCIGTDQVTITVNPLPIIGAGADFSICQGNQTSLTANNPNGAAISWNNSVTNGVLFTPPLGSTSYTVTANLNGCINTDEVLITVNENPSYTLSYSHPTLCNAIDGTITFSGLNSNTEYNVNHSNGTPVALFSDAGGNIVISGLGSGTYNYFEVELNNCLTNNLTTIILEDPNPPIVGAGMDQSICQGENVTLSAYNPDAASISWDYSVIDGIPFTPSAGTIIYTVTATDANSCVSTDQVEITVHSLPIVNAGSDFDVCQGTEITLSGSGNATNYSWNNSVIDGTPFNQPPSTVVYTLTGESSEGCISTDQITVIVTPSPLVDAGVNQAICLGENVTLTATGNAASYSWNNGIYDGVAFSPTSTTIYTVTATDANNCTSIDQVSVTVNQLPNINAGVDQIICEGNTITLYGSGTSISYIWSDGVINNQSFLPSIGTITYTVIGTDANGCQNSDQVTITVLPQPIASFIATPQTGMPPLEVDFTNNSSYGTTYTWDFGNGYQDVSNSPDDFVVIYNETGSYQVLLTVNNGTCSNSATTLIIVENLPMSFILPNIFTPNGDGLNDVLHFNLENVSSATVHIFNRWGNKVGEINSVDSQHGWNGNSFNGLPVNEGVYFYNYEFVGLDGEVVSGHHFVHLNR